MQVLVSLPTKFKITSIDDVKDAIRPWVNSGFAVFQDECGIGDTVQLKFDFGIKLVEIFKVKGN